MAERAPASSFRSVLISIPARKRSRASAADHDYADLPNQRAIGVLDNTPFGGNQTALPGPWTLPSKNNPWLQY